MKKRIFDSDTNDLTSMVDVTFLLLIFFVVTASFASVKVMSTEPAELDGFSQNLETPPTTLRIVVDEYDRFYVEEQGVEEPVGTPRELRHVLHRVLTEQNVDAVLIDAHARSHHQAVVQVCDASRAVGLHRIKVNPYK